MVRWLLVAFHFYMFRDWYIVHSCLFADDGAFILASTLVPVEECDDQSAWLRVLNEDPHSWTHEGHVLKCSKEWSVCWFCFEFWPSCTILLVVECCRLAHCICSLILGYFVMFYWCDPRTSVLLLRWLHCIFTCLEIDIRTVYSCLFADDGAFILASTLVPVEEFDDQSAWLRVVYAGSTFLDAWSRHVVKKWRNMEKIRVCYVSDCSEMSFKVSEVFADCVLNFDDLYNGWRIVERCRLAQCSCSLNLRDFVMFYWLWFTYFCAFGALVVGCIAFLHV